MASTEAEGKVCVLCRTDGHLAGQRLCDSFALAPKFISFPFGCAFLLVARHLDQVDSSNLLRR